MGRTAPGGSPTPPLLPPPLPAPSPTCLPGLLQHQPAQRLPAACTAGACLPAPRTNSAISPPMLPLSAAPRCPTPSSLQLRSALWLLLLHSFLPSLSLFASALCSATLPNAFQFAQWVSYIHTQPCHVVYTGGLSIWLAFYGLLLEAQGACCLRLPCPPTSVAAVPAALPNRPRPRPHLQASLLFCRCIHQNSTEI